MSALMTRYRLTRSVLGIASAVAFVTGILCVLFAVAEMSLLFGLIAVVVTLLIEGACGVGLAVLDLVDDRLAADRSRFQPPTPTQKPTPPAPEPLPATSFDHAPRPKAETLLEVEAPTAPSPALVVSGDLPASKPLDEQDLARLERAAQDRRQR